MIEKVLKNVLTLQFFICPSIKFATMPDASVECPGRTTADLIVVISSQQNRRVDG